MTQHADYSDHVVQIELLINPLGEAMENKQWMKAAEMAAKIELAAVAVRACAKRQIAPEAQKVSL